ncbi:MAG: hypothetical protein IPJ89_01270 [Candidatus Iainarchaeum archaeon]|uniref:Uncharacterized protein n=1 Tax=Candidatus Iainarchaeum sp. TaxID=3101447 RepID=A0A7T9I1Y6_9ARCH|nr:MAG: hypothetical protein IPJ89_01270 [Candidatus Diapherotrites archaeon]
MNGMYHLARVLDVFSRNGKAIASDTSVQAHLEMWDENILTFDVHPAISDKIAKDQVVLVEYGFHSPQVPENQIVKILETKQGEESWKRQKSYLNMRKKQMKTAMPLGPMPSEADIPDARMVR